MLPDRWNIDIFESACAKIAFYSDPCWMVSDPDNYYKANQELWINYNRIKKRYDENLLQNSRSTPDVPRVRTVRDIIPSSNLAKYGNYEYNDDRENLYETDNTSPIYDDYKIYSDTSVEPWMLPEVENEFKRLTGVPSAEYRIWGTEVSPLHMPVRGPDGRVWACGRWWHIQTWVAMLLHYPELAPRLQENFQRALFSGQATAGGHQTPVEPLGLDNYPPPRYSLSSSEVIELHNRIASPAVRSIWEPISSPVPVPQEQPFSPPPLDTTLSDFCSPPSPILSPFVNSGSIGRAPRYFPSASDSQNELFPYLHERPGFSTSTPIKKVSSNQKKPDFYSQLMELSSIADRQGPWDRYDDASAGCKDVAVEETVTVMKWLQSVYPTRAHHFTSIQELVDELKNIEEQLIEEDCVTFSSVNSSEIYSATPSPSGTTYTPQSLTTTEFPTSSSLPSSVDTPASTSPTPPKRRLYRDVLASTASSVTPSPETAAETKQPTPPKIEYSSPSVVTTTSNNSIEKRFDELEQQALEQYRSSDDSISQHFQELERQALEQYQGSSSSSSLISVCSNDAKQEDEEVLACQGSKHCVTLKRTQSQHDRVAESRSRPAAASRSVCNIGAATAAAAAVIAATRPETLWAECGQGCGDRIPTKGTTARRRLVLHSPVRAVPIYSDGEESDYTSSVVTLPPRPTARPRGRRGADKLLSSSPLMHQINWRKTTGTKIKVDHCRGGGGGDDKPVTTKPSRNDAGPNEQRTQVSSRLRIQSANITNDDPAEAEVTVTCVQPTTQSEESPEPEEEKRRCRRSKIPFPQYSQKKSKTRGRNKKKKRKKRLPLPSLVTRSSPCLDPEELEFRTRSWRRLGLVPYDTNTSDVLIKPGLVNYLNNCGVAQQLSSWRRRARWPEDSERLNMWNQYKDDSKINVIYKVTAQVLARFWAMKLRRLLANCKIVDASNAPWCEVASWVDPKRVVRLTVAEPLPYNNQFVNEKKNSGRISCDSKRGEYVICKDNTRCTFRHEMSSVVARAKDAVKSGCILQKTNSSPALLVGYDESDYPKRPYLRWRRFSLGRSVRLPPNSLDDENSDRQDSTSASSFSSYTTTIQEEAASIHSNIPTMNGMTVETDSSSSSSSGMQMPVSPAAIHVPPTGRPIIPIPGRLTPVMPRNSSSGFRLLSAMRGVLSEEKVVRESNKQASSRVMKLLSWSKHKPAEMCQESSDGSAATHITIESEPEDAATGYEWIDELPSLHRQKKKRRNEETIGHPPAKKADNNCSIQ